MVIDVSEVVNDPDLAQSFSIIRSTGQWINGVWNPTALGEQTIPSYGVIVRAGAKELDMIPEGDRIGEVRVFWSAYPIFTTKMSGPSGAPPNKGSSSDILTWRGLQYRVLAIDEMQDYGFFRAVAKRLKAN